MTGRQIRTTLLPHQRVPDGDWTLWMLYGGRGLGKTHRLVSWVVHQALRYPGTDWRAVGRTWSEARDILAEGPAGIRAYLDRIGMTEQLLGGDWRTGYTRAPGDMRVRFANGSQIVLGSADNPDALRGGNYHGAICDELAFWDRRAYANLRFAVRLPLPDGAPARIVAGTTPLGQNWLYEEFIEGAPNEGVVFIGGSDTPPERPPSTYDNPFLDRGFVSSVRSAYEGTDLGAQEIHGSFVTMQGAIYKGLRPDRHGRVAVDTWPTGPDQCDEVIAGQDLGSEHPSALIVLARVGDRWHAVAEVVKPAATEADWNESIAPTLDAWQPAVIYSDRNFPQTTEAQRRRGLPVQLADKGAGSVVDGIRAVQQRLAASELVIDDAACPRLWGELRGYRWATDRDGQPLTPERPVKSNDDAADALRYAVYMVSTRKRTFYLAGS